jgi:hypothetical protein
VRQRRQGLLEVAHPQGDVLERTTLPRLVRREERELPSPRVGSHECEGVRAVDDVHPEVADDEVRHRVAVPKPVGNVVERLRFHDGRIPPGGRGYSIGSLWTSLSSAYFCVSSLTTSIPLS